MSPCQIVISHFSQKYILNYHLVALVHLDICGPYHTTNHDGSRFFLTIVDDFFTRTWIFLMQNKTKTLTHIQHIIFMVQTQFHTTVQRIRIDNARDFFNSQCSSLFLFHGMLHESSCTYTQWDSRTKTPSLVRSGDAYLVNCMPTRVLGCKTPYEVLFGKSSDISHI